MNTLTRGAVFGAACALCAIVAIESAAAQTYPPGTNCQSLLPGLRGACIDQARQAGSTTSIVPNSGGSGAGSLNSGTTVTPNGTVSPNAVTPNGTINPNAVTPNGTINPNTVRMPDQGAAPATGNQIVVPSTIPSTGTGTGGSAGSGAGGTGTGGAAGTGAGTGTSGN
jgi:hypothetical protein